MDDSFGLSFDYILPGLVYSKEEVLSLKKRNKNAFGLYRTWGLSMGRVEVPVTSKVDGCLLFPLA